MPKRKLHPIGYVARTLGLSPHVIRAWEKRYNAVQPGRSGTNRRLYSQEDMSHLALLKAARAMGQSISTAAKLDARVLGHVAASRQAVAPNRARESAQFISAGIAESYVGSAMDAVRRMNETALEKTLQDALVNFTRPQILAEVISPLLEKLGCEWSAGLLKIAKEHLASSIVENFLWDMLRGASETAAAPRMVVGTPAGQLCEYGAMMAAVCAADCGWKPIYLGANLPAEELAAAALLKDADAVAISIAYKGEDGMLCREVSRLRGSLKEEVHLFIGGRAASACQSVLKGPNVFCFENLTDFCNFMTKPDFSADISKRR